MKGVCLPKGFKAAGVASGLKVSGKKDCALVYSEQPAVAAAAFTKNLVKAAPIQQSIKHLEKSKRVQAVIVTSGNANAATGRRGLEITDAMCTALAEELNIQPEEVLIAQTGLIGIQLNQELALSAVKQASAALSSDAGVDAMWGMATTDSAEKVFERQFEIQGKTISIGGMAKGSGMISPSMATMLGVITTDAAISEELLQRLLSEAVEESFNASNVDGACSTNDCVFLLANSAAGNSSIDSPEHPGYKPFKAALTEICHQLACAIVKDGEGASKFLKMVVKGASSKADALKAAKAVVSSMLVKCSLAGEAVYWGRILAELGASGAEFDPNAVEIYYGDTPVFGAGEELEFSHSEAEAYMKNSELLISADLKAGDVEACAYGCDLSYEYVKINMEKS